jgi:hypothetical protein
MFMPKQPVSVTLDRDNLLWLRGRMIGGKRKSLSEALDALVTEARRSGRLSSSIRSVVGTIDIAPDDPLLERADAILRTEFDASFARPILVREVPSTYATPPSSRPARKRRRRA